eukprot:TRINITY_DN62197_c0_g1_i1.p1 TRINITY_DN62197_c0_g1~~TRINITY_DN62197_c0_g1_i1.p1  ORF type:complete len:455 (-),score=59.94 TRINITY_DN62197_c0_g1_i1:347-1678(-)
MLAATWFATWRSQRLYPGGQVSLRDVRSVVHAVSAAVAFENSLIGDGDVVESLRTLPDIRQRLWRQVAGDDDDASFTAVGERVLMPLGALWRRVARWLLSAPDDTPPLVFLSMSWGGMDWMAAFLRRALQLGIPRFIFTTPDATAMESCLHVAALDRDRQEDHHESRVFCVRALVPFARPYDVNNYAKFFLLPLLLSLGVDVTWLDLDIFLLRDPTERLLAQAYGRDGFIAADVLTTDHFDLRSLNHGVFFIKASDRTLTFVLRYIAWLHENPFAHDQNGWDAFLGHSVRHEARVRRVESVRSGILDVEHEFVTLTAWSGSMSDLHRVQLLHFTGDGITGREKVERMRALFNVTLASSDVVAVEAALFPVPRVDTTEPTAEAPHVPQSPGQRARKIGEHAVRRILRGIRSLPVFKEKGWFYEGMHMTAVEPLIEDGSYWTMFT